MGQQRGRVPQAVGQARGQGAAYGVGGGPAFQPGGDGGGEAADVPLGEQQPGLVAVQVREERGGVAVLLRGGGVGPGEGGRFRGGGGFWAGGRFRGR
ncbi:hypothetical protein SALBM135S_09229 [Streptomyces alboniger]